MTDAPFTNRDSLRRSSRPPTSTRSKTQVPGFVSRKKIYILISVISLATLVFAGWWLTHRQPDSSSVQVIMKDVSRHYVLPTNETPALATVTDSQKVQSSFTGKVKNGDKILIYQNNKQAIIYRPSLDRIIDIQPVSIDTPPSAQVAQ